MTGLSKKYYAIKTWAKDDRPREKFISKGRASLSDAELLAIQLGSGSRNESALDLAKKILKSVDGDFNKLARLGVEELQVFKGVGEAKAVNILSALEIGVRRKYKDKKDVVLIACSKDIYIEFYSVLADVEYEEFWCAFLNKRNEVIKKEQISTGGIDASIVDIRKIMKRAILLSAPSIIVAHNHPSGNIKPSKHDIAITEQIKKAAKLMTVSLLDHIIIGDSKYYSFLDDGML